MATSAILNAVWDLWAKQERKVMVLEQVDKNVTVVTLDVCSIALLQHSDFTRFNMLLLPRLR